MSSYGFFLAVLSGALLVPFEVNALRCESPPNPVDIVNAAGQGADDAIVGYGTFSGVPLRQDPAQGLLSATYTFSGMLFRDGDAVPAAPGTMIISSSCNQDIWCGHMPISFDNDKSYLVVFERDPATGNLSVHAGLCRSSTVLRLDSANLTELAICLSSGTCTGSDLQTPQ